MIRTINLQNADNAMKFVLAISKLDIVIDAYRDHYVVDAKSIMGLLSLGLSRPLNVEVRTEDPKILDRFNEICNMFE